MTDDREHTPLVIRFYKGGEEVDAYDLPDELWEHGHGEYPNKGYDHAAHEISTEVLEMLRENYDWAEDFTGASFGV